MVEQLIQDVTRAKEEDQRKRDAEVRVAVERLRQFVDLDDSSSYFLQLIVKFKNVTQPVSAASVLFPVPQLGRGADAHRQRDCIT